MKIGQKFENLTVLKIEQNKAICSCSCGSITPIYISELESGQAVNCGTCHLRKKGRIYRQGRRPEMHTPEYKKWRTAVYKRDKYKCKCCDSGFRLNAHHLNCWSKFPLQRYEIENGVTLCSNCHQSFHYLWGNQFNTREQFITFLLINYNRYM